MGAYFRQLCDKDTTCCALATGLVGIPLFTGVIFSPIITGACIIHYRESICAPRCPEPNSYRGNLGERYHLDGSNYSCKCESDVRGAGAVLVTIVQFLFLCLLSCLLPKRG